MKPIKSIELEFDADLFKKGEDLYISGAILELIKVNTSLYSLIIREGKLYEVELLKPLLKGQKATCDCQFYKTNKTCRHIVAALLYYRDYAEKVKQNRKVTKPVPSKSKVVTIKSLLVDISEDELKTFVQTYASSDKKFSNALKVNFIRKIDLEDNEKKYKVLLDSIIRPVASKEHRIKSTELKNFRTIVYDLLDQAHDAIALGEFVEASLVLKTVLVKLHYIDHYYTDHFDEVKDILQAYYLLYNELLNTKKISTDLREDLKEALVSLMNSSFYHSSLNLFNAIELFQHNFLDEHVYIIEYLERRLADLRSMTKEEQAIQLALLFRLRSKQKSIKEPFSIPIEYTSLVEKTINNIKDAGYIKVAIDAAKYYIHLYPKEIIYTTILLELFIQNEQEEEFIRTVVSSFVKSKDLRLIDLVKKFNIDEVIRKVREGIKNKMPKTLSSSQKAILLKKLEDWDGLMAHLYQEKDLRMMMQYDRWLYKEFKEEVTYLYMVLIEAYLDQHLGDFAYVFINELKMHFDQNKMNRVSKKVDVLIANKYSHRTKLNDQFS